MRQLLLAVVLAALPARAEEDPFLWLEGVEDAKALEWVEARNKKSLGELQGDPRYAAAEAEARAIILAQDRIPMPALRAGWVYNFWQDKTHVRGLWRRAKPKEYAKSEPKWETVLDLDALAKAENENWVWKGAGCLPPAYERCMVRLSRGGKDAAVLREFDAKAKTFVKEGFELPEAKSDAEFIDRDTLLVGTDFGPGTLTDAGYPRVLKRWKRGTPLSAAETVYECRKDDTGCWPWVVHQPEGTTVFAWRSITFFSGEQFRVDGGTLTANPMPDDADPKLVFRGRLFGLLRTEWKTPAGTFPGGSLIALPLERYGAPDAAASVEAVFTPTERTSFQGISASRDRLYLETLDNVRGRLHLARREAGRWLLDPVALPDNGVTGVAAIDPFDTPAYATFESFLVPTTLVSLEGGLPKVKQLPARFDPKGAVTEQYEAVSRDGTKVPYFVVRKEGAMDAPTLLYGYGGFEAPELPEYLTTVGKLWLEKGGIYAQANIRGGGEFGPRWHQAALKKDRQRAYDDFIAVAEDLIRRGITRPAKLGIMGGSNGGLLVGVAFTQRPDLFKAVSCQVPLADMMRYHKLLAGASWMGEYGNPEDPAEGAAIRKYSPYQNLAAGKAYPRVFFLTSTKDDRVHPGHARKMVAKMEQLGYDVLYYENTEGGHSAAANLEQRVKKSALTYSYLYRTLMDGATVAK